MFWGRFDLQNSHQLKPNHHKKSVSNQLVTGNHEYSMVKQHFHITNTQSIDLCVLFNLMQHSHIVPVSLNIVQVAENVFRLRPNNHNLFVWAVVWDV